DPALTGTINLTSGSLISTHSLNIVGPGASRITVARDPSAPKFYILSAAGNFNLSGLTITGGDASEGAGFQVATFAHATLDGMVITGNNASGNGGGIVVQNSGSLNLLNSTISNNTAGDGGGGIWMGNNAGGTVIIETTTIAGNVANGSSGGGGIYSPAFSLGIRKVSILNNTATAGPGGGIALPQVTTTEFFWDNATIAGNSAFTSGGGIYSLGTRVHLRNFTITGNTANGTANGQGGGGLATSQFLYVHNSVVSGNSNFNAPDILSTLQTEVRFSAIGNSKGFTVGQTSGNNLPYGTNLKLGPIADNGGSTLTMLPQSGSPLINAGSNSLTSGYAYDQRGRGFARISGASVDIGAVEVDAILPTVLTSSFNYATGPQSLRYTFSEITTLGVGALELHNLSTGIMIPAENIALSYNINTKTATFTFPGYPNGVLPDGDYRAFLLKDGVEDYSHNHLATDHMTIFSFLLGDLNGDRSVSISDFITLASSLNKSNATYADGDVNYDGTVSISDFIDLAARFNTSLPTPPSAAPQPAAATVITRNTGLSRTRQAQRRHLQHHHTRPHLLFRFELQ
ncbi:MAG TPA: choice-of-anchor Q domain-containing protein, partial [Tepidisphaeraceae bacterium]|nr:choice-of-anchor Q domain-containing protein [Tepidisphaeraceae bacterium]